MKNYRGFKYPETMDELKNQPGDVDSELVYVYLSGITPVDTNVPVSAISSDEQLKELCEQIIDEFRNFFSMDIDEN